MTAIDQLKSVLCDPEGKCCIAGSDEDRAIVDRALEALAQPVQEPDCQATGVCVRSGLYVAPLPVQPERSWVGLTDDERNDIWEKEVGWGDPSHDDEDLMKAIEAKLKDKNHG
jgi:hypothetical protein